MFAIAAMSRNRVIGRANTIPWRIPDELRWFRRMTLGRVVIMGRRTFESLPKPLDGRVNVVLTRHPARLLADERLKKCFAGAVVGSAAHSTPDIAQLNLPKLSRTQVRLARGIDSLVRAGVTRDAFLCGGVQVYQQFLAECSELYLSVIDREVEGDALFPPFEDLFDLVSTVAEFSDFRVLHYVRNRVRDACRSNSAVPAPTAAVRSAEGCDLQPTRCERPFET
jgi:dihydrofolate reductase